MVFIVGVTTDDLIGTKKILIVDDESNILDLIQRALSAAGYEAITADTALDGLLAIQDNPVSLLITDVKMPGMNGLDLIKQVRELDSEVPIAVISGYGTEEMAMAAIEHGAFYFINKPFNMETILEVVSKGIRLPTSKPGSSPGVLPEVRQRLEMTVLPDITSIKSACSMFSQTVRIMGYPPEIFAVKAPFVLDELLVNDMKWREGNKSGPAKVFAELDREKISLTITSPEGVFQERRLPMEFFDSDYDSDTPAGMKMILMFTKGITFSQDGRNATTMISTSS